MHRPSRIINLKNFSNINLFQKRADEQKLKIKNKQLFRAKLKKNHKSKSLKKTEDNTYFSFPILNNSTISLISELYPQLSSKDQIENSLIELYKKGQNNNKQEISKVNSIFLTASHMINKSYRENSSFITNNNKIKENTINKFLMDSSKENINKTFYKNKGNSSYSLNNNFSNTKDTKILLQFQNEKNLINNSDMINISNIKNERSGSTLNIAHKSSSYFKNLINHKISLINLKRNNTKEVIEKSRELKYYIYSSQMQNEAYKRSKENELNEIEYYNDKIKVLNNLKKLFNIKFIDKLGDYIKFINSQIEIERTKNISLINNIIKLKNEIKQINNKLRRKNLHKKNILKWVYFQIQLKEKKLTLPSYYRTILENYSKNDISSKEENEENNIRLFRNEKRRFYSVHIRRSRKNLTKTKPKKNQGDFNSENGLFYNKEIDLENPKNMPEIFKIKNYKSFPIYNTIDELNEVLVFFDNKNIAKIKYHYDLRMEIFYLKKELLKEKKEIIKEENNHENSIIMKQKDLNEINDNMTVNNSLIQKLKKNTYKKYNKTSFKDNKNISLLKHVSKLYNTCKSLALKTNFEITKEKIDKNKDKSKDFNEILEKLTYITFVINYLLSKFKIYNSNEYGGKELLNKLKNDIDKNHKIEYAIEQRKNICKKNIELRKIIYERNNKIYFLPNRKLDFNYNTNYSKSKKKSFENNKLENIFFEDLINN